MTEVHFLDICFYSQTFPAWQTSAQQPSSHGKMSDPSNNLQTATLGGGCFWCFEALFEKLEGVLDVVSGYAAGQTEAPTYK